MSAPAASSPGAPLTEREAPDPGPPVRAMAVAFAVLRVFTGVVWLSNAAAKLTGVAVYDWGVVSFNLVTTDVARAIAGRLGPRWPW